MASYDEDIDNSWVDSYKKEDAKYKDFYNEPVKSVNMFFIYVNTDKTIVNIKQKHISIKQEHNSINQTHISINQKHISKSTITHEQIIRIIKEKQICDKIKYKLFSIVRYNVDLLPEEVGDYANEVGANEVGANEVGANEVGANEVGANEVGTNEVGANEVGANEVGTNTYSNRFLTPENYINDIQFSDTISIFQDLNSLYIIFKEQERKCNLTKKNKQRHTKRYTKYKRL